MTLTTPPFQWTLSKTSAPPATVPLTLTLWSAMFPSVTRSTQRYASLWMCRNRGSRERILSWANRLKQDLSQQQQHVITTSHNSSLNMTSLTRLTTGRRNTRTFLGIYDTLVRRRRQRREGNRLHLHHLHWNHLITSTVLLVEDRKSNLVQTKTNVHLSAVG